MVSNEEHFGLNAGKVWAALKTLGPMNVGKISSQTDLEENEVIGALGWLGREGKISIDKKGNKHVYSLMNN